MIPVATGGIGGGPDDRIRQAQTLLIRIGQVRFGPASPEVERQIRSITDLPRLEALVRRALAAASWQDLLAEEDG